MKPYEPASVRAQPSVSIAASDAENVDSSNGQSVGTSYQEEEDLLDADFKPFKQLFQAVLINPGALGSLTAARLVTNHSPLEYFIIV